MAFVSEMVDQLRLLLNDATDSQVAYSTKKLYLNLGIRLLFPGVYRMVTDSTIVLVDDTFEYAIPAALRNDSGIIVSVEIETGSGDARYIRLDDYDIVTGDEDLAPILVLSGSFLPSEAGAKIRIRAAMPCTQIVASTYAAAQSETWVGPDRVLHLPVYYALGMIAGAKIDDRQDHTRLSTTQMENGTTDQDIMQASQLWLSQFQLELDQVSRPLPIAKD